jgi:TPR repeat protein
MVTYAEDRSSTTQFELGELFDKASRRDHDYSQAFNWYKQAAQKGSRRAQHRLASMYARGQGVERSLPKAYAWCKLAVFQHSRHARRKLKFIEARMCLDQLRRGRWLARDYYDLYVLRRDA